MNSHALAVLEFPGVLDVVAGFATSPLGASRIRALRPGSDTNALEIEHARVAAVGAAIGGDQPWHPEPAPDLVEPLARLRVEGVVWTERELLDAATLLRSSRRTRESLEHEGRPAVVRAVLAPLIGRLARLPAVESAIERAINEDATVRDDASPMLRRLRRESRDAQGELVRLLEREAARLDAHHRVPDMSVTLREGRYVIPVRREGRAALGGIVHGTSASGGTVFVEPPAAVEFGNRMRELEAQEAEETLRILRELTALVRPHREDARDALDALVTLDTLFARARYGMRYECGGTALVPSRGGFAIERGRHPLLLAQGKDVVPFDLTMTAAERVLLVSGPNTGGKTVLLKALGLLSAMAQSGIPAPAGAASRIPMFDDIFADIGDEQSIEASLSTFSAHLKNLGEVLRGATAESLVLVDELGSGTDPTEGAALGWAILEELGARGTMTIATTHLGTLKDLATQVPEVVNASLQFDGAALAPTYRLIKGVPGRSYGIAIARRLQLPEEVVQRAEQRLPQQEREVAALIERLERREAELEALEAETAAVLEDARARIAAAAKREHNVRERERTIERQAREGARRYLLDARREIEETIRELRARAADAGEAAEREARHRAETLAARQGAELERLDREEANVRQAAVRGAAGTAGDVGVGDTVLVGTLEGKRGRVLEIRGREAVVAVGAIKMTVPVRTLEPVEPVPADQRGGAWIGDAPELHVRTELDVRGMRADEMETVLMQALDSAIRADLRTLRIIHGKGTGALRERVAEMLRKDTRVRQFRAGAWNEGGTGVTVADLS